MRRPVRLALLALLFLPTEALADSKPPAWPVRANVSLPLGASWGRERVHGFTWGFRGTLAAYPFDDGRGAGGGVFADDLIDANTHSFGTYGLLATVPFASFDWFDVRAGAYGGLRRSGEGGDDARRLGTGLTAELALPAYLYDFRVGLRFDATFDGRGMSSRSFLVEVDVVALLGLFGLAAGAR